MNTILCSPFQWIAFGHLTLKLVLELGIWNYQFRSKCDDIFRSMIMYNSVSRFVFPLHNTHRPIYNSVSRRLIENREKHSTKNQIRKNSVMAICLKSSLARYKNWTFFFIKMNKALNQNEYNNNKTIHRRKFYMLGCTDSWFFFLQICLLLLFICL